jgi:hypothetical protein
MFENVTTSAAKMKIAKFSAKGVKHLSDRRMVVECVNRAKYERAKSRTSKDATPASVVEAIDH